ncbi:NAD-glutamate dehydrogenase [Catellatospora bangladeshensis]|uniref:NAD-glutamate dehydrogenase n=1 Tax=Catellatospora bangladeshensis TaxID=310355 RepID=A0A8J3NHW7_9ACTN|nr:NAD-glutamate dehydrogenase [Catellatospora bangladeshensis]GIF79691.1 NAD-glutamate dehydrogenase [Catellatospora bangladeshensis]
MESGGRVDGGASADVEAGASGDTIRVEGRPHSRPDDLDDSELDEPLPNGERLIAAAVALAAGGSPTELLTGGPSLADDRLAEAQLVQRYWRFAPDEELVDLTPARLIEAARAHRELAQQRKPGELKLRLSQSEQPRHTVVEVVTDDMPFLVDSVTAALSARKDVQLLVHPVMVVRRDDAGTLTEVCADVEPDDAIPGDLIESWMRIEVGAIRDEGELEHLRADLERVLGDVRKAVEDWPRMRAQALALADEISGAELPVPDRDITDSVELLRWLSDHHFTFLGYREYELVHVPGDGEGTDLMRAVPGTGLGILRDDDGSTVRALASMTPEAQHKALEKRLLIITKANSRATVHRSAYLDYIGFKTFDADGNVDGERRFLGLFSSAAYRTSVRDLPVIRRKVDSVLERSGLSARSHSGKDLVEILETYPRDELFQISTEDLYHAVTGVLRMAGRRQLRLFLRRDGYGRFISCLIYLPRDRFTTAHRLAMQDILLRELNGVGVDYTTRVSESNLARIHFIVRTDPNDPPGDVDVDALAEMLGDATRNWDDDFRLVLERKVGDEQARLLASRYVDALPETYKDGHLPYEAAQDLAKLELLEEPGQLEMHLFRRKFTAGAGSLVEATTPGNDVRFKVYRHGEPMLLSAVLPVLHSLGVRVTDERPYEVRRPDATVFVYDFGLQLPAGARDLAEVRAHVENAFAAAWRSEAEVDGFNELVLRAGLTWRQVVILRAYAKYLRQAGTVFSQESMESTFTAYPQIAAMLVALFETRFNPGLHLSDAERGSQAKELISAIGRQLEQVASLDQDRILRNYLTLMQATLRTSFFQKAADGRPKSYIAFKLDPQAIPDLPAPRPKFEIFVYSPRFEGVHLRFGAVARGGLRWSDRRDDFRTEILGLVKAQMVKNAVIVPVGAKGGFVLKQAPSPADRDAYQAEGVACYRRFISALLDITDNLDAGKVVPPADVVRHDGDDPYLVVAADKGTATFSDIANEISASYGFWLGDAFASGGSAGYDHKKMGITARGAWESVKRHFRDLGHDTQTQDFTVVGVGDMSGDVFGNGMLLSEHIRLVAAFDHRHVFLDPDPDAASSYAERRRMFDLPRSSWAEYDTSLISEGGGVFPRTAKSIPITPQVRAALGLADTVTAMSPAELMKAILLAPVDLLWNGGIGTYVKATTESHAEVGDKANDAIRVNGAHLRARVVGEGGNLGLTQAGRIEYARKGAQGHGGRIFTDFIDNSAGVDCSDHEVNIKILLGADPDLTLEARNELLASMTDEVAELVLRDNYGQATTLGNARAQTLSLLPVHRRLITELERAGKLDRALEGLPTDEELAARGENGEGLSTPEFAVLMAYVKIVLEEEIVQSDLPDEAWTAQTMADYFPTPLRGMTQQMAEHRLRRDIVTTVLVNETVNRGGITFIHRAVEETGAPAAEVLRAFEIVWEVFDLPALWAAVEATDNVVPTAAQTAVYLKARRLMDRAVRWLIQNRRAPLDVPGEIAKLKPGVADLMPRMKDMFVGAERAGIAEHEAELTGLGAPQDLAERGARTLYSFGLLDVVEVAAATGRDLDEVAGVYFVLSERFHIDDLLTKISMLPRDDRWQTLARMALRYDLYAALAALTAEVLAAAPSGTAEERVVQWEQHNANAIAQARKSIAELDGAKADLAPLSVLLRQIRTLVRTAAAA